MKTFTPVVVLTRRTHSLSGVHSRDSLVGFSH
jgi:hypothetical protein